MALDFKGIGLGLLDHNGKELHEGDFVTSEVVYLESEEDIMEEPAQIVYKEQYACFGLIHPNVSTFIH